MNFYESLRAKTTMVEDFHSLTSNQHDSIQESLPEIIRILKILREKYDDCVLLKLDVNLKSKDKKIVLNAEEYLSYYPIGCCREIVSDVFRQFRKNFPFVDDLRSQGIPVKRIWGLHKGSFHNAIQVGNHYIDIAQDSFEDREGVFLDSKLEDSEFSTITSYGQYFDAVENDWGKVFPNIYFPHLSLVQPYFVNMHGTSNIYATYSHSGPLLLRDMLNDYQYSQDFLKNGAFVNRELPSEIIWEISKMAKKRSKQYVLTPRVNETINEMLTPVFDRSKFFKIRNRLVDFRRKEQEPFDKRADILARASFQDIYI